MSDVFSAGGPPGIKMTTLEVERPEHGLFVIVRQRWEMKDNPTVELRCAYTPEGKYISGADDDYGLLKFITDKQIVPEIRQPDKRVCSIGQSRKTGKWWGWSHRAIHDFDTRDEADKFAESVSALEETAAAQIGTHIQSALDQQIGKKIAQILTAYKIVPVTVHSMHCTLFQTALPEFNVKAEPFSATVPNAKFWLIPMGKDTLALAFKNAEAEARNAALAKRALSFAQKRGYILGPAKNYVAHVSVAVGVKEEIREDKALLTEITQKIRDAVAHLSLSGEYITEMKLAPHRAPKHVPTETPAEANRRRLAGPPAKKKKEISMSTLDKPVMVPGRIVPGRQIKDPLMVPCADYARKLADLYERRKIAGLVGQGRTVMNLNMNIRLLRQANGLEEDPSTRPLYVGHDSNIDPRGGLMTEQAGRHLRGHRRIMEQLELTHITPPPAPGLNIVYDLDWSRAATLRGLASVYKILSQHGYVARRSTAEEGVHAYEFTSRDGTDAWSFTCCRGGDWCFDVRHNGKLLGGTFTIAPGAPVEEQGVPESMVRDGWDGCYEPIEAQRYQMAWRNVLSMIRAYAERVRPATVNMRGV